MERNEIREMLSQEAARLAALRDDVKSRSDLDESEQTEPGGEISGADQHPADAATETMQREIDLGLLENIESELDDVERALSKLSDGTYGKCDVCGKEIGDERLRELPATPLCIEHANAAAAS